MDNTYVYIGTTIAIILAGWFYSSSRFKGELAKIISSINKLSRLKNVEEILQTVPKDFVNLFKFDYTVISTIDFIGKERKIISKEQSSILAITNPCNPKRWYPVSRHEVNYDEEPVSDILVEVVKRGHQALAIRGIVVELDIADQSLNQKIYKEFNHKYLARIYYPIVYRRKKQDDPAELAKEHEWKQNMYGRSQSGDIVIGVVECGYYLPWFSELIFSWTNSFDKQWSTNLFQVKISSEQWMRWSLSGLALSVYLSFKLARKGIFTVKSIRALGQLYTDNLAQGYYQAYCSQLSTCLLNRIAAHQFEENYQQYATATLTSITDYLGADLGILSFKSLNYDYIHLGKNSYIYPENYKNKINTALFNQTPIYSKKKGNSKGIVDKVFSELTSYYTPVAKSLLDEDPYFINAFDSSLSIRSELVCPVLLDENKDILGVAVFDSSANFFFNAIHATIVEYSLREFATLYARKKRYFVYSSFTSQAAKNVHDLFYEVADALKHYYNTNFITVWQRDIYTFCDQEPYNKRRRSFFELVNLCFPDKHDSVFSEQYQKIYAFFSNNELLVQPLYTDEETVEDSLVSLTLIENEKDPNLLRFYTENQLKFNISIKVRLLKKTEIIIHIFSKRSLPLIYESDIEQNVNYFMKKDLDFLNQIAQRMALSLHNLYILEAINKISSALFYDNQSSKDILPKIAEQALIVTRADNITIFPYENRSILNRDAIRSGGLAPGYREIIDNIDTALSSSKVANTIINSKIDFISWNNLTDYKNYFYKIPETRFTNIETNGFWFWNKINSAAAVPLNYSGEPVGVIIVNYKEEDVFVNNPDLKKIIIDFCCFAGIPLRNYQLTDNLAKSIESFVESKNSSQEAQQKLQEVLLEQQRLIDVLSELKIYAPFGTVVHSVLHHSIGHVLDNLIGSAKEVVNRDFTPKHEASLKNFEQAMEAAENSVAYSKRLIKLFNKENFEWIDVDINEIIKEELVYFRQDSKNRRIRIEENYDNSIPLVRLINAEFSIVINNLLQNAVDSIKRKALFAATGYLGKITIRTVYDPKAKIVAVYVHDNGGGIKDEVKQHIYELGFSTKKTGTGIGLYFVYEVIVNKYRGKLLLSTEPNEGTTFELRIPERIRTNSDVLDYKSYL